MFGHGLSSFMLNRCYIGWQVVEVPNVSWDDIGGLENVKRELQEVCRRKARFIYSL